MNTPPPIYVGPGTPARCAAVHEACAVARAAKTPMKAVAEEFGVSRSTLRKMAEAHTQMHSYDVQLAREGSTTMRVCTVVTPKGSLVAAVAAYREYPGTLKGLELPGWTLQVGGASYALEKIRSEASDAARPLRRGPSFAKKYGSLTNATRRAA